jgi:hypothetical protein
MIEPEHHLRESLVALEEAREHLHRATVLLFGLFPGLNADETEALLPPEPRRLCGAISEAGGYIGSAMAELERFARRLEEEHRPEPDPTELATLVYHDGSTEKRPSILPMTVFVAPTREEGEAALARGKTAIGSWNVWRCARCQSAAFGGLACPSCHAGFEEAHPESWINRERRARQS